MQRQERSARMTKNKQQKKFEKVLANLEKSSYNTFIKNQMMVNPSERSRNKMPEETNTNAQNTNAQNNQPITPAPAPAPVIVKAPAFDPTATYAVGDKVTINFNGKDVEATFVQPGVVQKTESIYYIRDSKSGEWLYCYPIRLATLRVKYNNDLSGYLGRESRSTTREEQKKAKKIEAEAKAKARAELLEKIRLDTEAKLKAKADAEAKAKADANAKADAKVKTDAEAKAAADTEATTTPDVVPTPEELAEIAAKEEAEAKKAKKVAAKKK